MSEKKYIIKFSKQEAATTSMVSWETAMPSLRHIFKCSDDEEIVSIDIYDDGIQANFHRKSNTLR